MFAADSGPPQKSIGTRSMCVGVAVNPMVARTQVPRAFCLIVGRLGNGRERHRRDRAAINSLVVFGARDPHQSQPKHC